jgi:site-specific DNA-cytosine methylase
MRALDLFAGTGGLAAAFSKAVGEEQMRVEHAIDNNGSAAETMRYARSLTCSQSY